MRIPRLEVLEDRCMPAGTVTITALQAPSTLSAAVPAATEGQLASPSLNAAFTDTNAVAPGNLTVTVNYGDGTPVQSNKAGANFDPNLLITQVGGAGGTTYTVTDTHTFLEESGSTVPGPNGTAFTVTLTVTESANAANADTRTAQAQVLDAALSAGNPVQAVSAGVFTGGNTGNGTTAAQALAAFETAIGGAKNTAAAPQGSGFRTITWDGVKVDGTDNAAGANSTTVITPGHTVGIPLDRFQGQGVFFGAVYAVSNDGFVDVNPSVNGLFPAFSSPNTFAMFNDNGIDFKFVVPSATNTALVSAASRGFGSIFLNVQQPGTTIQYFSGGTLLDTVNVPTNATAGAAVFAGELFTQPIVTNVLLTLGNGVIFKFDGTTVTSGSANSAINNLVAVDDWAFAEPTPITNGFPITTGTGGTLNATAGVNATEGTAFTGVVASFSDLDPKGNAKDYTATINWGDGHLTNGTITKNTKGGFDVSGTNTYATAGAFPINVDVFDFGGGPGVGGSQPSLAVNNIAKVADAALTAGPLLVSLGTRLSANNIEVATFTDAAGPGPLTNYTATIDWGDGSTPSTGTMSLVGISFFVSGSHVFPAGKFTINVTIQDVGGAKATAMDMQITVGTPNQRFVAAAFQYLLKRTVDPDGLNFWAGQLDQGVSQTAVLQGIENSPSNAYRIVVINGYYQRFLHRTVDQAGLNFFLSLLANGGTDEQVAAMVLGSPEYFQMRAGSSNSGFLTAMYQDLFNRAPDANALSNFTQALASGAATRTQVAAVVLASPEYQHTVIQSDFQLLLHRPADNTGLAFYTNSFAGGARDEDVLNSIFTSPEFLNQL
jgi:hypothetical protein